MRANRRGRVTVVGVLGLALASALPATAATPTVAQAAIGKVGTVLVDARGFTLYRNTKETTGKIACTGGCAKAWPPLLRTGTTALTLAKGLGGRLSTIKRPEGTSQITYNGIPLYRYAADTRKGVANGQGLGRVWYVVKQGQKVATTTPTTAKPPSGSTGTTTTAPPSGGPTTTAPYDPNGPGCGVCY